MSSGYCDECKAEIRGHDVIRHHFGRIETELDMQFCKKSCEEKMIAAMLGNRSLPHDVHHAAIERNPMLAKSMKIGCNLGDACPKHKAAAAAAASAPAPAAPAPDTQQVEDETAEGQDQIGANVLTKIKRAFSSKDYVASTGDAAADIIKRIKWYRQKGGIVANRQTIRNEGNQLRAGIVGMAAKDSGMDLNRVDGLFERHNTECMVRLEQSKEFFPNATAPQVPLKHSIHDDSVLTKEMFIILRRSLNPGTRALVNTAQLTEDLQRTYNRVVNEMGADGYEFLKSFFYDATEAGIAGNMNKKSY